MRVKLTLDRGNTAIKAAAWSSDGQLLDTYKGDESLPAGDLVSVMEHRLLGAGERFAATKMVKMPSTNLVSFPSNDTY